MIMWGGGSCGWKKVAHIDILDFGEFFCVWIFLEFKKRGVYWNRERSILGRRRGKFYW